MESTKASVRKETVAVSAAKPKIARKKPEHTAATPSEPSMTRGRSVSRKRSIRGKSNPGVIHRQPCRYYFKGTSCEYWHSPEQPNKKPKKSYFPPIRESDDKNAVAMVKNVSQLGCVSQDSDALVSQGRKSRGNQMHNVFGPIPRVRFTESTLRHASIRKKTGQSLRKINVKFLISEVPTL